MSNAAEHDDVSKCSTLIDHTIDPFSDGEMSLMIDMLCERYHYAFIVMEVNYSI